MNAQYVLFGVAMLFLGVTVSGYLRQRTLGPSQKVFATVAAIYIFVLLVLRLAP